MNTISDVHRQLIAPPVAIIFDLDGTLVDSRDQIKSATQSTRQTFNLPPASEEQLDSWFGMKPDSFFFELSTDVRAFAIAHFRDELSASEIEAPPFPEVKRVLARLGELKVQLAVGTTKPSWLAKHVLKRNGLLSLFHHIQGTDNFPAKPSPALFTVCLETLRLENSDRIWGIGDRLEDAQAAAAAGVLPIGLIRREFDPKPRDYHLAGALATVATLDGLLTLIEENLLEIQ